MDSVTYGPISSCCNESMILVHSEDGKLYYICPNCSFPLEAKTQCENCKKLIKELEGLKEAAIDYFKAIDAPKSSYMSARYILERLAQEK